jgi:hypothetical protein
MLQQGILLAITVSVAIRVVNTLKFTKMASTNTNNNNNKTPSSPSSFNRWVEFYDWEGKQVGALKVLLGRTISVFDATTQSHLRGPNRFLIDMLAGHPYNFILLPGVK